MIGWKIKVMGIIGAILNAKGKVSGFYFWIPMNIGWIILFVFKSEFAPSVLFAVYTVISVMGIITWKKNNVGSSQ